MLVTENAAASITSRWTFGQQGERGCTKSAPEILAVQREISLSTPRQTTMAERSEMQQEAGGK